MVVVTCETTMMPVAWEQVRSHVAAATERRAKRRASFIMFGCRAESVAVLE